jgi:hypothetical protein
VNKITAVNNDFAQWLGLSFSFGKSSMIRNFVLYLLWSMSNHQEQEKKPYDVVRQLKKQKINGSLSILFSSRSERRN